MDIIRLYRDYGVDHKTEGHKHCRPGWVNTECPFCTGNPGYHLGWNIQEEYYFCWRCGWHPPVKTISILTNLNELEVQKILPSYGINRTVLKQKITEKQIFELPSHLTHLKTLHKKYLRSRGFDPAELQEKWGLMGTGNYSKLGNVSYKFRIVIPFYWNGEIVSFDSRDITGKQLNKYQACPIEYEKIEHKSILYGNQEKWDPQLGICVEGPTDVWRMSELAFATSGIQYTQKQLRLIASTFKRVAVLYDDDPQAQKQAKKLVADLKFRGVNAWNVVIKGDPGALTDKEARKLIKEIKDYV